MNHVHDGTLIAFLDEQLTREDRQVVVRHIDACTDCAASLEELREAAGRLDAALALIDRPAPVDAAERSFGRRRARERVVVTRRALVRAAGLVLGCAAVASAALPQSPVRDWAVAAWRQGAALFAGDAATEEGVTAAARDPEAGVAIPVPDGQVRIVIEAPAAGLSARVRRTDGDAVAVYASGAAASADLRTRAGRIDVIRPGAGELWIDLPRSLTRAVVEVDGRVVLELNGDRLTAADGATMAEAAAGEGTELVVPLGAASEIR